jgi:hypothetical protein
MRQLSLLLNSSYSRLHGRYCIVATPLAAIIWGMDGSSMVAETHVKSASTYTRRKLLTMRVLTCMYSRARAAAAEAGIFIRNLSTPPRHRRPDWRHNSMPEGQTCCRPDEVQPIRPFSLVRKPVHSLMPSGSLSSAANNSGLEQKEKITRCGVTMAIHILSRLANCDEKTYCSMASGGNTRRVICVKLAAVPN